MVYLRRYFFYFIYLNMPKIWVGQTTLNGEKKRGWPKEKNSNTQLQTHVNDTLNWKRAIPCRRSKRKAFVGYLPYVERFFFVYFIYLVTLNCLPWHFYLSTVLLSTFYRVTLVFWMQNLLRSNLSDLWISSRDFVSTPWVRWCVFYHLLSDPLFS